MPKPKPRLTLSLNLLKPQNNPEKIPVKLIRWLLSSGRYIFVLVNAVVLIAFGARFKLDADLASKKEAIEQQIPYIESLKPYEILIRETQFKLSTIDTAKKNLVDWSTILQKIANQTPASVKIISINIKKGVGTVTVSITGQTQVSNDITRFVADLKGEDNFSKVSLASVDQEQGIIKFTIGATTNLAGPKGKNL